MFQVLLDARLRGHNGKSDAVVLIEGTQIERNTNKDKTESEIENELIDIFSRSDKINLVYASGQNIDRLVSIYRACKKTEKLFVVDVYTATVLKKLSEFASFGMLAKFERTILVHRWSPLLRVRYLFTYNKLCSKCLILFDAIALYHLFLKLDMRELF